MIEDDGLGLDEFLNYDPDAQKGGGDSKWLKQWKDNGHIDIFLHTESKIRPVWGHQIPFEIEVDGKNAAGEKTGKKELRLSWPRFVSPDTASVHANQFFYDDNKVLREQFNRAPKGGKLIGGSQATAYMSDPFLILREYLRHAINRGVLDPDVVVFEWVNHKQKGELIQWTAGELSRHEKRGFKNRGHSLDTKLEYIFVVVDYNKPEDGPKVARETKLVGEKMRDEIKRQIESRGDDGDPFTSPYCFRWKFDKDSSSPMKMYDVYRMDKNVCTPDVWKAIGGAPDEAAGEQWDIVESIDTSEFARVNEGDMAKIRQCFESAAQIELPLDQIFSEDWEVRKQVVCGALTSGSASRPASSQATRPTPGAAPGGAVRPGTTRPNTAPTNPAPGPTRPAASAAAPSAASGPQSRRKKKVEEPAPAPEPEVELIPCEGPDDSTPCGHMLRPDEAKCPKCGAEYDIGETVVQPEPKPTPAAKQQVSASGVKRPGPTQAADAAEVAGKKCIACGSDRIVKHGEGFRCENCGCEQGDDIPF